MESRATRNRNYGDGSPDSYKRRFEEPFKPLLDAGVKFYASIGNHDAGPQWNYPLFNMNGRRYYTFEQTFGVVPVVGGERAQFLAVDTGSMDAGQLTWIDRQLSESTADWKIVFQHHPLYTSGRYLSSAAAQRRALS